MSAAKRKFLNQDWFAALAFSVVFFALAFSVARGPLASFETGVYDLGVRLSSSTPSDRIAVIAIDDESIANIGRWPWSRNIHANLIERLAEGGAKVIASTVFFSEPQLDDGLLYIRDAREFINNSSLNPDSGDKPQVLRKDLQELSQRLGNAETELNADQRLVDSMQAASNVLLPIGFQEGDPLGRPDGALPSYLADATVQLPASSADLPNPTSMETIFPPVEPLARAAGGLGHLNFTLDTDGGARSLPLIVKYFDQYFPSLALVIAARSLNLDVADIRVTPGEQVALGNLSIRTTPDLRMYNAFYPSPEGSQPFPVDSFFDVFVGQVPVDKYRNKIVLIGSSAAGIGDAMPTPVSASLPPVQVLAHVVSGILQENFFVRPTWAVPVELLVLPLLILLYLAFLLPRLSAVAGAAVSGSLLALLVGVEVIFLVNQSQWLQLALPAAFLVSGHVVMSLKGFRLTEQARQRSDHDSVESNKMLGLAFQGQGQLDMAYEKFRRCPMDNALMELLYNLALDYERKRQFNKAGAVYSHMAEYDIDYRDLRQRVKRSQNLEETLVLGRGGVRGVPNLLDAEGDVQKPMLGRYEIEKEIGKGAMGVVYLGRDPKINRVVAIKTIPLSEEFEEEDLSDAKDRFFREAETAGRLNHPNIVTIFDVGEEHDLAYIAMEFLEGDHLNRNTRAENLLPPADVLDIIARTADALHYAHKQNIVHRDIKPANIMYEPVSKAIKVTDFGIARITDSSKTKTGIVLGTPSYMSPEQLGGKQVDGRSDLFSLGVTFYQLLSGQLPFQADSMGSLMFKIANEAPTPLNVVRPDLPACINDVVARTLTKDPDHRFQTGEELANELRRCAAALRSDGEAA